MAVMPGVPLLPHKYVLRLVKNFSRFVPNGKPPLNGEAFQPSSEDVSESLKTSKPIRVSVWDLSLTQVGEAKAFRSEGDFLSFELSVANVMKVKEVFNHGRLAVIHDPLNDPRPSAEGHCGIEGLDRLAGESTRAYKAIKDELAILCRLI